MITSFLQWVFGMKWWALIKVISNWGAPIVIVIGIAWYIYDRYTGGV